MTKIWDNRFMPLNYALIVCAILTCVVYLPLPIDAGLAPTWDSCGCYWGEWRPWSQCSKTCGGGRQYRDRLVWHRDVPECDGFEYCASNDMGYEYQGCNQFCQNGGTFTVSYSYYGYCSCVVGKTGTCCEQTVNCGTPSTVTDGSFIGSNYDYNNQITYVCNAGYNMTDPTAATRTCTRYAYWDGTLPRCLFAESCGSNPCQNGGTCINGLGFYTCQCREGWSGQNCEIDIQPPVISQCPPSVNLYTSNMTEPVSWVEPEFSDPLGFQVVVSKNYQSDTFEFPWGVYTVAYDAVKPSNGLNVDCSFEVSVKPFPCNRLDATEHAILACNGWHTDFANICKYYCQDNFTFPIGFSSDTIYACTSSGYWMPSAIFPGCIPEAVGLLPTEQVETFQDCINDDAPANVSAKYIEDLTKSAFNELCLGDYATNCVASNVLIEC